MNHVLSAIVLAFSSNIDNLSVAIAYGIMPRKIYFSHNLLIAVVSGSGTWISMSAGEWINNYMSEGFANILGSVIMILIGFFNVVQAIRSEQNRFKGNEKTSSENDLREGTHPREAFALAISLTFNNLGGGLGAGISHISIPLTTILTIGLSVVAIAAGYQIGKRASLNISKLGLGIASGLLIMAVGVYEYFV
jgi:putative Mn2+ efflux pump MntP